MATISKPFDPSKFTKSITKSIKGISTGFNDPDTWISTGNYALNKRISGSFNQGIPLGKITMFAGASGSGKSFVCSGSIVKYAQQQDIFCVLIDSENALDEAWLKAVGVDTSPDKLMRISASLIDDVAKIISDFVEAYKTDYLDVAKEDRPKVLFVIDSLGMLLTPVEVSQFEAGDMKGDMGRKAKQLKALVTNVTNMIGNLNIGIVMTNHTYASQNMFDSTPNISGGSGIIFASSIVVLMDKLKLKKDEDGNKTTDVQGIRSMCQVVKTRYAKPFEKIELEIPYSTGLDPYSGLFDYFLSKSVLTRTGNKYIYNDLSGNEHKYFEKEYRRNENNILDLIMNEWTDTYEENEQILDDELANNGVQQ
jgi:RecA/RadA recombinase